MINLKELAANNEKAIKDMEKWLNNKVSKEMEEKGYCSGEAFVSFLKEYLGF